MGATPICVRRRLWRAATTALTVAVVFVLFVGALADSASAGIFSDATSRLFGRSKSLDLAPIVGAPANVSQELAQALVAAGKDNKLTITPNGTGSSYTLKGFLVATSERKGAKVSYILDINDSKGGASAASPASSSSQAAQAPIRGAASIAPRSAALPPRSPRRLPRPCREAALHRLRSPPIHHPPLGQPQAPAPSRPPRPPPPLPPAWPRGQ